MHDQAPNGNRLSAFLDRYAEAGADAPVVEDMLRALGFEGLAVDFLQAGATRDLEKWRRDPHLGACRTERGDDIAWTDATIHDYKAHLLGLLRNIGVDHTGTLLKRRRRPLGD
jgi:hypothetical protein